MKERLLISIADILSVIRSVFVPLSLNNNAERYRRGIRAAPRLYNVALRNERKKKERKRRDSAAFPFSYFFSSTDSRLRRVDPIRRKEI